MKTSRARILQLSIIAIAAGGAQTYIKFMGIQHCFSNISFFKQIILGISIMCGVYDILLWTVLLCFKLTCPTFFLTKDKDIAPH